MMRLARAPAAVWLGLAALAAIAWREGLAFALSSGAAGDVESMFFDAADNPPWLISLVSAGLLFSRRHELRARVGPPASRLGASALLAPGLALLAWARFVSAPDLALLGMVLMALGTAAACFGARFAWAIALPVGLLAFAIPAPGALVNHLVYPLQLWTSDYAFALLRPLGLAAIQSSDVIRTASHVFLVIEGCSGLGSMEVLTLLALAWAWYTGASFGRGLVLALAAPGIAFALNGPRVAALVLFPDSPFWSGHTTQGVAVFALGALLIALLDGLLPHRSRRPSPAPHLQPRPPKGLYAWLGAAALLSVAVVPYEVGPIRHPRTLLPEEVGGRPSTPTDPDELFIGSVHFSQFASRLYRKAEPSRSGGGKVSAFVGEDNHLFRIASLLSPKNALPGRGWVVEERGVLELPGPLRVDSVLARSGGGRALFYHAYFHVRSVREEALREFLGLDQSPWRRPDPSFVIRVGTPIEPTDLGPKHARERLRLFLRDLTPVLSRLDPAVRDLVGKAP